jgi:chromosome segregation protein
MKLTQLIMHGFKSFADKTVFDFDQGISCVVGPNGCGKSNVVDAIKWVLGEQSAKSLRGGEMMDVIFNGTSSRKPAGRSSVTLVFDNSEGMLKLHHAAPGEPDTTDTISITRRLYRSGQSEYLINNNPARLRDIKEMFLDTGLGGSAYSIIEQGRVTQFLQASQDERRAFFDEAAGISRYKQRRKEALRKLDRVEQNLFRLQDIVGEVDKRLRSIKIQATKARNYQEYTTRLRELRSLHILSQYHRQKNVRTGKQAQLDAASDTLAAANGRIAQLEAAQRAAEAEATQLEQSHQQAQSQLASINAQVSTLEERIAMQSRRLEELSQQMATSTDRAGELEDRLKDVIAEIESRTGELAGIEARTAELRQQSEQLRDATAEAQNNITRRQGELDQAQAALADLDRQIAQHQGEIQTITIRQEKLEEDRLRAAGQVEENAASLDGLQADRTTQTQRLEQVQAVLAETRTALEQRKAEAAGLEDSEQDLREQLTAARDRRSALQGRIHTLDEMHQAMEGLGEGTRRVMQAVRDGKLSSIRGLLGDEIRTSIGRAGLVEAALAGADEYLLADSADALCADSQTITELLDDNGQAHIVCLDRQASLPGDDVALLLPQVTACVLDWVKFPDDLEPLLWRLLGHTFAVKTLDDAFAAARACPPGYRFVTKQGELLDATGRVRLGQVAQSQGVISRQSELADLQSQVAELDESIAALDAQCTQARQARQQLDAQLEELRTALTQAGYEKTECEKNLSALDEKIASAQQRQPRLAAALKEIAEKITASAERQTALARQIEQLQATRQQRGEAIETLTAELDRARTELAETQQKGNDLRVALAEAEQKHLSLTDALAARTRQKQDMDDELQQCRRTIELDRTRRAEAEGEIADSRDAIAEHRASSASLDEEVRDLAESRQGTAERLAEIRRQITDRRAATEESQEQVNTLRVAISELDAHISDLITRAAEEMQMDLVELYARYEHDEDRDWQGVEAEIKELRGKIDRLGNVNLDAIEEQDELEQRRSYLDEQLSDVTDAQGQLEELIRRLNKESRERFIETFTAVRENFQTIFRKLFGGGKADVTLVDPDDVLESPIEIVARPPGKELRSISLLSGGEKTMAALAMIFGFFQAKPSPFCLLDEVDAALDEANTDRFNNLVREFIPGTQFIIISHAKRTMSMAGVLYGVTMQQRGISTRISVKFEQADQVDELLEPVA